MASLVAVSCNGIEEEQVTPGRPVTLTVGLAPETKVSHEYGDLDNGKVGIKTAWEADDFIFVQFDGTTEIFQIESGVGEKTATFHKESSLLPANTPYKVTYASPRYMYKNSTTGEYRLATFNINGKKDSPCPATVDGTLENLPEYLVANVSGDDNDIVLESQLVYFHFIITHTDMTKTYPYHENFYLNVGSARWGNPTDMFLARLYNSGLANYDPDGEPNNYIRAVLFIYPDKSLINDGSGNISNGDSIERIEFYCAGFLPVLEDHLTEIYKYSSGVRPYVNLSGNSYKPHYTNGSSFDWPTLTWKRSASNEYVPGKVYKKTFEI